ncbi:hypothetical protein EAH57_02575 [Acinetobacter sp. 2JN-4]|uniref:hypothetical protein n=1 Tax=unclassified Acinetobacter TaxID=196816 RepID=UPI0002CE6CD7|nr:MULTISPECIES: hypothetical protein [unclassified Acinetobacter]MDR7015719.1 hypothetical protein [Prolinoborus sp. 3657]ENU31134.1 hypothetical protein F991_01040 [Acinetobacter sp. CIP-A165]ENW95369.1 hypothetical protein F903_01121 [Acinetobacter sp. NIPH 298]MCH7306686.1 hypothetical protein [Acinetobacter sp. NIPH 1852]RLZ11272.1 hypothetical protein EAH57_02575 [Acinetobacter sp. 2JN-4]
MSEKLCPETSPWGWKALIITIILSFVFMVIFYLAITNEPDYMPSHKQTSSQQHALKTAPAMSPEALEAAKKNAAATVAPESEHHQH